MLQGHDFARLRLELATAGAPLAVAVTDLVIDLCYRIDWRRHGESYI